MKSKNIYKLSGDLNVVTIDPSDLESSLERHLRGTGDTNVRQILDTLHGWLQNSPRPGDSIQIQGSKRNYTASCDEVQPVTKSFKELWPTTSHQGTSRS